MANAREILSRIESVQDTRKIISIMYLISSTKLKESKKLLEETKPCFYSLQDLIRRILCHMSSVGHFYFNPKKEIKEEDRTRGPIVVIGGRGLAGTHNYNVLKIAQGWMEQGKNHWLYVVGELGHYYFEARCIQVEEQLRYTVQNPTMHRVRLISSTILEGYKEGRLDEAWIIYTQIFSSMQTEAGMTALPPLRREDFSSIIIPANTIREEIQMVPSPGAIMDHAILNYVTGFIFGALVGSFRSEQSVRMMAMQPASDNANATLDDLSIKYSHVGRAIVTQEITEVISGAKAQKKKHS